MPQIRFTDNYSFADLAGNVRETANGYLIATPRVARTGIQKYRGVEIGHPEMDWVRVYRPQEQVFDKKSLATFSNKPITNDHPGEMVTADNWKDVAVGHCGEDILRDGEMIRIPMTLCDKKVINDYRAGKKQLSVGYTCDLKWEAGKTRTGEEFDAIQTDIKVNHVAVVTAARGGDALSIGDDIVHVDEGDDDMEVKLRTITVDGLSCQVADQSAEIIQRREKQLMDSAADLTKQLKDANDKITKITADAEKAAKDAKDALEKKDAELVTVKKMAEDAKLTPEKLGQLVKDRAETIGKAKVLLGDKLVSDGKTVEDIRKQVVEAKLGDAAKGWNDEKIEASFQSLTADIKADQSGQGYQTSTGGYTRELADQFSSRPGPRINASDAAYVDRSNDLQNRWKPQHIRDAEAAAARDARR